jgi:hypothetical protein
MDKNTLVIIPAYNEEKSIGGIVISIRKLYPDFSIVVIDDASADSTAAIAKSSGAFVLSHPFNMGYGVSVQTGYKYALYNNYDYIVQIDADGQHRPEDIKVLIENLENKSCDIILGSRFIGETIYRTSIYRMLGIKFFRTGIHLLTGLRISDPTTGFQVMRRRVLDALSKDIFPHQYPDADIILLLHKLNFKIMEAPVCILRSQPGKSMHRNPVNAIYYIFAMLLSMLVIKLKSYKFINSSLDQEV